MSIATAEPKVKKRMTSDLCVFADVYIRLVGTKENPELWIPKDQGIPPKKCQYATEGFRDKYENGTFFIADVELSRNEKFYRILGEPQPTKLTEAEAKVQYEVVRPRCEQTLLDWAELQSKKKQEEEDRLHNENKIPSIPSNLFIRKPIWNLMAISVNKGKYPILLGPKGCGKTKAARSLAKALGMEFKKMNAGAAFKPEQFFGGTMHANEQGTEFLMSEFLTAFQATVPTLILLDEITRLPQNASNYLMDLLDREQNSVYVKELGKHIYKSDKVSFIATGNVGMQYTDTRTLDGALWDRLVKLWVDYLSPAEELELVKQTQPSAPEASVKRLIAWANICRQKEKDGELSTGVSTRQVLDMADFLAAGMTLNEVYEEVFLFLFINGNQDERANVKSYIAGSGS